MVMRIKEFTLEISLKPFLKYNAPSIEEVCNELFSQWATATENAEEISILLWTSDGSEILEFSGELNQKLDWARYIGCMNRELTPKQEKRDPEHRDSIIGKFFEDNTQKIDYNYLKILVETLKKTGTTIYGKKINVGTAFDPGPEFSVSNFKYKTHPEICKGGYEFNREEVVSCYSKLNADNVHYAGYPDGIPQGTPFGKFLGRQLSYFLKSLDMDFIWFSNGFGFGNFPWNYMGVLYDGKAFFPEKIDEVKKQMLEFWNEFKSECDYPTFVRGTNLTTGRDLSCDGVPLKEIYDGDFIVAPPVNSPWAPLNLDFGSEIIGWMSHICGFPKDDFTFRLYVNDPWFQIEPWLKNYESEPYDIYLPLSISRINKNEEIITASRFNILTVDDCHGELPRKAIEQITPHLSRAEHDAPDAPGPFIWLYPFNEYHEWLKSSPDRIQEIFAGDHFMRDAINKGLPLNTVVSTSDCKRIPKGRVVITPVPEAGSKWENLVLEHVKNGGEALLYGPLQKASKTILELVGIELDSPLSGYLHIEGKDLPECHVFERKIKHEPLYSAGGITEKKGKNILFSVSANGLTRTLAAESTYGKGKLIWLRTSTARCHAFSVKDEYYALLEKEAFFEPAELMRSLLFHFGWDFKYIRKSKANWVPVNAVSLCRNGFFFSGCNITTTTEHKLKMPFGAPAMMGTDFEIRDGFAHYRQPMSWHNECRIFINQKNNSIITCHEKSSCLHGIKRWIWLRGLNEARLNLFIEPGAEETLEIQINPRESTYTCPHKTGFEVVQENGYKYCKIEGELSGTVLICW